MRHFDRSTRQTLGVVFSVTAMAFAVCSSPCIASSHSPAAGSSHVTGITAPLNPQPLIAPKALQVSIEVLGVAIPFTAFGIIHRLETVPGVTNVKFDLPTGKATLTFAPNVKVTDSMLRDAVRDASYTPGNIVWLRSRIVTAPPPREAQESGSSPDKSQTAN